MSGQAGSERLNQKERTRAALLQAARSLLAEGKQPSVLDAADRAKISRATAYRYFSTPEAMTHEAALDAIAAEVDAANIGALTDDTSPEDRVAQIVDRVLAMVLGNEQMFRTYLRTVLAAEGEKRGGRRVRWLKDALGSDADRLGKKNTQRLIGALSLLTGIETVLVLRDVCGFEESEIRQVSGWAARTLVASAFSEARD